MSHPSFKWMPSRDNVRDLAAAGTTPATSRPCLPAVEQLGDRILLSAVAPAAASDGPPPVDRVLIGLLQGELKLATQEAAVLKLVGGADPQLLNKLTDAFAKVNRDIFLKLGDIKGESLDDKHKDQIANLDQDFLKIDNILADSLANLPGGAQETIKAAIGDIKLNAGDLLDAVSGIKLDTVDEKVREQYLKISDDFLKLDQGLLKIEEQVLTTGRKAGKGQQEFLLIKMNDVIISSIQKLSDGNLKENLAGLLADTDKILIGLLQPSDTGDQIV
jgi:type VI secretion system secreted protein Hcp